MTAKNTETFELHESERESYFTNGQKVRYKGRFTALFVGLHPEHPLNVICFRDEVICVGLGEISAMTDSEESSGVAARQFIACIDEDEEVTVYALGETPDKAFKSLLDSGEIQERFDEDPETKSIDIWVGHAIEPYPDDPEHWDFRLGKKIDTRSIERI